MNIFALKEKRSLSVPRIRPQSSRFGHRGPEVKAQQSEIYNILRSTGAQAKLTIGQPNDKYEQEADRVVDQVMHMSDADVSQRVEAGTVQPMKIQRNLSRMAGRGHELPARERTFFENRLGHDLRHVRIHADTNASDAAEAMQARAFTVGSNIGFRNGTYSPGNQEGRSLLAHELTHVVQQTAPPTVTGRGVPASGRAPALGHTVQRYKEIKKSKQSPGNWNVGSKARVADNGLAVTSIVNAHECWASGNLIKESNRLLKSKNSGIEIKAGGSTVTGKAPATGRKRTLKKVVPTIRASTAVGGTQDFWADCGRSSREVMGPHGTDTSPRGVFQKGGKLETTPTASSNPANFRDDIFVEAGLGSDRASAAAAYRVMSKAQRRKFDRKHKINQYADPGIGEAFVSRRDDVRTSQGFNFHWGGVIMVAGRDKVTLENFYKGGGYAAKDTDWYFEMYGPPSKPHQTFHRQNEGSVGEKNKGNVTMAATTDSLLGETIHPDVQLLSSPTGKKRKLVAKLASVGTKLTIMERRTVYWRVEVTSGPKVGKVGWIAKRHFAYD